jgi:hypothetical protein
MLNVVEEALHTACSEVCGAHFDWHAASEERVLCGEPGPGQAAIGEDL